MKSTGMSRPVDALGRIVIPKEIRASLGIKAGDRLSLSLDGDKLVYTIERSDAKRAIDPVRDLIAKCASLSAADADRLRSALDEIEAAAKKE